MRHFALAATLLATLAAAPAWADKNKSLCPTCGVVQSVQQEKRDGQGGALGMVGGITGRAAPATLRVGAFFQVGFNNLAQEVGGLDHFRGVIVGVGGCAHIPLIVGLLAIQRSFCGCCTFNVWIQGFTTGVTSST